MNKIITICWSLRFKEKMMEITEELELWWNCVLSCIYLVKKPKEAYTKDEEELLDKLHKQKIDMSDAIFVVNVGWYIWESTRSEIEYAKKHNKEIMYLE